MGRAIDLFVTYRFIKLLVTPFEKTDAFKLGIIDKNGPFKGLPLCFLCLYFANIDSFLPVKTAFSQLTRFIFSPKSALFATLEESLPTILFVASITAILTNYSNVFPFWIFFY